MRILIGVTGGIAAIKIPELIEALRKVGADCKIILTQAANTIISETELKGKTHCEVFTHLFTPDFSPKKILSSRRVTHIELAKWADLIVVIPATANTIAKLAHGIADDLLCTTILASQSPVFIFPSMNTNMWLHKATQVNIKMLKKYGYYVCEPAHGELACGTYGVGRLPEINTIVQIINTYQENKHTLKNKKIIVTSGATREAIDDVRFISNRSSGKMGSAIAEICIQRGARVTLLSSQTEHNVQGIFKNISYKTYEELENNIKNSITDADIIFHTAAVTDFTTSKQKGKISSTQPLKVNLEVREKIIHNIKKWNPTICLIGFKAEWYTNTKHDPSLKTYFMESNADFVIVNNIARQDIGFESDENEVDIYHLNKLLKHIPKNTKMTVASDILDTITPYLNS